MKKLFLFIVAFVFAANAANGQDIFRKGDLVGNLGIGLGNDVYGSNFSSRFPPLSVSMEYGIADNLINGDNGAIGIGGYLGYTAANLTFFNTDNYVRYSSIVFGARGTFHYQFIDNLDTYAGLMLGYRIASSKAKGDWGGAEPAKPASVFIPSFFIGARYYFTEQFGAFAELGYGVAFFSFGVTYKF